MTSDDLTLRVLIEIRDEARATKEEVRATKDEVRVLRSEVRATNDRLDQTNERLETGLSDLRHELKQAIVDAIVEADIRAATRSAELTASTRDLYKLLEDRFDLRDRVERCERDIDALKQRVS